MRNKSVSPGSVLKRVGELGWISPVSLEPAAIHEKCRSGCDATAHAGVDVSLDPTAHCGCQVVGDRNRIDANGGRILDEIVGLQGILVSVQKRMHGPKGLLSAEPGNGFGCFRRGTRVRMLISDRKIPKNESHVIADVFQHLLQDQVSKATLRVLVVTVLDQRDWRVGTPACVIVGPNGDGQYRR